MSDRILQVIAAVHQQLADGFAGDQVEVIRGPRATRSGPSSGRVLCVATSVDIQLAEATMDAGLPLDATVTIACLAEVLIPGEQDQAVADAAVLGIHGAAVDALRVGGEETLGMPDVVLWARPTGRVQLLPSTSPDSRDRGRGAAVLFTVTVRAEV
jgi:hypothetical protein